MAATATARGLWKGLGQGHTHPPRRERERAGKKAEKAEKERSLNLYSTTTTRCIM